MLASDAVRALHSGLAFIAVNSHNTVELRYSDRVECGVAYLNHEVFDEVIANSAVQKTLAFLPGRLPKFYYHIDCQLILDYEVQISYVNRPGVTVPIS